MLTWPRDLIVARTVNWQLVTPAQAPQSTLGGVPQGVFLSGGPFWMLTLDGLVMKGRNQILAGRALQGALTGGRPILVRPCDCRQAPRAVGGGFGSAPVSAGSPFDDVIGSESNPIVATIAAAALRAATVAVTMVSGQRDLEGGEHFSVTDAEWGQRMHRLTEAPSGSPPVATIRPLLRAATTNGQPLNFNRPGCVMRLEGPFDIEPTIPGRVHTGRATFVELERALTEEELA